MRHPLRTLTALACVGALVTACSGDAGTDPDNPASAGTDGGEITLVVATFNEFGYEDLFAEYEADNPGIKIEHRKAATSNEARDNMNTRLAAGSGLADIEGIEVDWLPELMQYPDRFVDLSSPDVEGRWFDWKTEAVTTEDGKLIGYGTDIGPEAVCYRADLFEEAGLPSDREEVAALLEGDWDTYFDVGRDFVANSDAAWFDSAGATFQGMANQLETPFENPDGSVIPLDENAEMKALYDDIMVALDDDLSAGLEQWTEDWTNGFQTDKFATMLCPGWMLGIIAGNAEGVDGWDIADVFPGGGGNWGGSYLTVPDQTEHPEEAKALAAWLTAPEQQIKAFESKGTFPSQVEAQDDPALLDYTHEFFNDAPAGEILANRASAIEIQPFKGPNYFALAEIMTDALNRVDTAGTDDAESSWQKALDTFNSLGLE